MKTGVNHSSCTWERFLQVDLCQLISQYKADLLNLDKSEESTLLIHFLSKSAERDPDDKVKATYLIFKKSLGSYLRHSVYIHMTSIKFLCICMYVHFNSH